MNKVLTISIAAYNVEKYIEKTLKSLVVPEILEDLEVFIIDDGGSDNTSSIAKKYEELYPKTFHVINKENGGYGTTVNWSVKNATGKYIKLLDGDDWFDAEGLKILVERLKKSEADVVASNAVIAEEGREYVEMYPHCRENDRQVMSLEEAEQFPVVAMWGYTFKLSIVRKEYKELPARTLYTDQIFVMRALMKSKTIEFIGNVVYYWRLGRDEQSNSVKSIEKHYKEVIDVANIIVKEYQEQIVNKDNKNIYNYQLKRAAAYYSVSVSMLCKIKHNRKNFNIIRQWEKEIKANSFEVYIAANKSKKLYLLRKTRYLAYWAMKS